MHEAQNQNSIVELTLFSGSMGSEHCQRAAGLLVCQISFPLCDCGSGHSYLASREECERISMVECEDEWTSARQYGIPLPNCTDLPDEVTSENNIYNSHIMTEVFPVFPNYVLIYLH